MLDIHLFSSSMFPSNLHPRSVICSSLSPEPLDPFPPQAGRKPFSQALNHSCTTKGVRWLKMSLYWRLLFRSDMLSYCSMHLGLLPVSFR